jgi:hypothetical protein
MRFAAVAATIAAAVLAVSVAASSPSFAATKKKAAQSKSVNECIELAMKRGYTRGDVETGVGNNPARRFVLQCMQGRVR